MPVRLERLVPLLLLLLLTCWLLRWILISSLAGPALAMAGFTVQQLGAGPGVRITTHLTYRQFLTQLQVTHYCMIILKVIADLFQSDTETRAEFSRTLQQSQLPAFFLETPGVTRDTLDSVIFEFVLLPADRLVNIQPDQQTFAEHFNACKKGRQVKSEHIFLAVYFKYLWVLAKPYPCVHERVCYLNKIF